MGKIYGDFPHVWALFFSLKSKEKGYENFREFSHACMIFVSEGFFAAV